MKTDTSIHRIELKHARDDIIRHKPTGIKMWNRPDGIAYLSIGWEFIHMEMTMYTHDRPATEVEQMLRDAKVWSLAVQRDTDHPSTKSGEAYTSGGEEE